MHFENVCPTTVCVEASHKIGSLSEHSESRDATLSGSARRIRTDRPIHNFVEMVMRGRNESADARLALRGKGFFSEINIRLIFFSR